MGMFNHLLLLSLLIFPICIASTSLLSSAALTIASRLLSSTKRDIIDRRIEDVPLVSEAVSPECEDKMKDIFGHFLSNVDPLFNAFMYSGKENNNLGNYLGCDDTSVGRFILTEIFYEDRHPDYVGICGPEECSQSDYEGMTTMLYRMESRDAIPPRYPISYRFTDPRILLSEIIDSGQAGTVLTILLIIGMATFCIIITGHRYMKYYSPDLSNNESSSTKKKKSKAEKLLDSFSFVKIGNDLIYKENFWGKELDVLHGVRFFTLLWLMLGFILYLQYGYFPLQNATEAKEWLIDSWPMTLLTSASLTSDIFFMLGGFFIALTLLPHFLLGKLQSRGIKNDGIMMIKYLGYRVIRLQILNIFLILVAIFILPKIYDGPLIRFMSMEKDSCIQSSAWVYNILMVNNLVSGTSGGCLGLWGWLIPIYLQMSIACGIICWIYVHRKTMGIISMVITIAGSVGIQVLIFAFNSFDTGPASLASGLQENSSVSLFFKTPWCRINSMLAGVVLAWIFLSHKYPEQYGMDTWQRLSKLTETNRILRLVFLISGIVGLMVVLFSTHLWGMGTLSVTDNALYSILARPAVSVSVALICLPLLQRKLQPLYYFYSQEIMRMFGRISFPAYMMGLILGYYVVFSEPASMWLAGPGCIMQGLDGFFLCNVAGFVLHFVFQAPLLSLTSFIPGIRGRPSVRNSSRLCKLIQEKLSKPQEKLTIMKAGGEEQERTNIENEQIDYFQESLTV